MVRPKEFLDGAVPAANSIAVAALLRADALGDDPARVAIERTVHLAGTPAGATRGAWPTWWRAAAVDGRQRSWSPATARPVGRGAPPLAPRGRHRLG